MKLVRSLNAAANKDIVFPPQKKHSSLCYQMSSLAVWVNEELSDEEWTQTPRGGLRPWVAVVETTEGKFSIAAAYWGLELMSAPTNVACHQNPIEPLMWTVSCSGNFLPWLHPGLLETGLGVDGHSDPKKGLGPAVEYSLWISGFFWGGMCILPSLPGCYYQIELAWEAKLSWMDYSDNPELPEGGNGAGALPPTFTEKSVGMKATWSLNSAPHHLWQQKCSSAFVSFIATVLNQIASNVQLWTEQSGLGAGHRKSHFWEPFTHFLPVFPAKELSLGSSCSVRCPRRIVGDWTVPIKVYKTTVGMDWGGHPNSLP